MVQHWESPALKEETATPDNPISLLLGNRVGNKIRRRATNTHSKSLRHHTAMQALFIAWYNFARKHETLKNTMPAIASGLSDYVWTIKELIEKAGA
jgi:hypothetical protein